MLIEKKKKSFVAKNQHFISRGPNTVIRGYQAYALACALCFHLHAKHATQNLLSWAASGSTNAGSQPCAWWGDTKKPGVGEMLSALGEAWSSGLGAGTALG